MVKFETYRGIPRTCFKTDDDAKKARRGIGPKEEVGVASRSILRPGHAEAWGRFLDHIPIRNNICGVPGQCVSPCSAKRNSDTSQWVG